MFFRKRVTLNFNTANSIANKGTHKLIICICKLRKTNRFDCFILGNCKGVDCIDININLKNIKNLEVTFAWKIKIKQHANFSRPISLDAELDEI